MPNNSAQFPIDAQTRFPMRDWISSFDRFAASFATGCLLLFGGYLICDGLTQHGVYNVIAFVVASPASGVVFTLPLLVSAYLLGSVSVLLSTVAFQLCFRGYNDEYAILDSVENRGHPILSKEVADIINAKRLVLASGVPLFLIGTGFLCYLRPARSDAFVQPLRTLFLILGILFIILAASTPLFARLIHTTLRQIHKQLPSQSPRLPD
jgi:hypothetical protein